MLSPLILLQILWTSLATSSCFVLFAVAFALVLKVNGVFNFAQAATMTVAFYAAFAAVGWAGLPGWAGCVAALAAALLMSVALEVFGFRTLRRRRASSMFVFIFTLIVAELVSYLAMLVFGTWPATVFPSLFWPVSIVGGIAVSQWDIAALGATLATLAALFAFLRLTRVGQSMVAVADNPDLAEFYGIAKGRTYLAAMIVAGLITGLAMFLYGTALAGAADQRDRTAAVRHRRDDHRRHRQSLGRGGHGGGARPVPERRACCSCRRNGRASCSTPFCSLPSCSSRKGVRLPERRRLARSATAASAGLETPTGA